jgi:hypothetical protein
MTDRGGNTGTIALSPFTSTDMLHPFGVPAAGSPLVTSSFSGTKASGGGSMTITATLNMAQRFFDASGVNASAVTNRVAVLQVVRETAVGSNLYAIDSTFTTTLGTIRPSITLANLAAPPVSRTVSSGILPGPFLFAPVTGAAGTTTFDATVTGLSNLQNVRVRVVAILEPHPTVANAFIDSSIALYTLPPTPIGNHGLALQYP